jgi:hypothetical protein
VGRSLRELEREVGKPGVERLLGSNPHHILAGEDLDSP